MIDLDEARKIVMKRINSRSPEGVEEFVITGVQEKPYGWVFSWGAANGEHIAGNVPIVVEKKTGEATSLYASGVNPAVGIVWFERELAWREHYDAALELFKKKEYEKATAGLQRCLRHVDEVVEGREERYAGIVSYFRLIAMRSLTEVQLAAGKLDDALTTALEVKQYLESFAPSKEVAAIEQRAPILENLMAVYAKQKRPFDADLAKRELGQAYRIDKQHSKAQEVFEAQLQKRVETFPKNHPAIAQTLTDLALLKADLRQFYEMEMFLDAALKIWEPVLQSSELLTKAAEAPVKWSREDLLEWCAETMDCYASNVLMRDGRRAEADKMRLRVKELLIGNPG